jgi:hypothetical protein
VSSIEAIRSRLGRAASIATVGGFRPPDDPFVSWLGQVRAIGRDQAWPEVDGAPMAGVFQVRTSELPFVPDALDDLALMTLFLRVEDGCPAPPEDVDDPGWLVRCYESVDDLVGVDGTIAPAITPFPLRWTRLDADLPAFDDAAQVLGDDELEVVEDEAFGSPADGLKVGGWPALIQSELSWDDAAFVLQVDSDEKTGLVWGDGGVLYLGRGATDRARWIIDWQCL